MAPYSIRVIGDPVLKQRAKEVTDIDGKLVRLVDDMFTTMYDAPGVGLAAPQIGVQKRLFVYDHDGEEGVLINPEITESDGEWDYNEGCLSIPGVYFEIFRPRTVLITGRDLDGNEVSLEVSDFEARVFQHELDHLDGILMTERITDEQRKQAKKAIRELMLAGKRPEREESLVIAADGSIADHR
ncbi:MAG: peptide deformylase [Acidimicrobiales bacterium]